MRILHVISGLDPQNGGPTFALEGLSKAQVRRGLDVTVAATWQIESGFPLAKRMEEGGVKVQLIGRAYGKLSRHPDLRSTIRKLVGQADVVNIHALWEEIQHVAAREAQSQGVPYIITPHGMLSPWSFGQGKWFNRWGKRLYLATRLRRNLDRAAAIHFTTEAERDLAGRLNLRAPALVQSIGVDLSEFDAPATPGAFRSRYPQLQGRPMVLFLSRLSPQKGLDRLIPAFARCASSDAMLVLAGPDYDGYRQTVEAMVEQNGVRDRVLFCGMLHGAQRIEALRDADLFVLPSRHENFGIVVVEALAAGTAVLVSPEVNIAGEIAAAGGGTVASGDPATFSAEMGRLLADPELRRATAAKGQAFVRENYDWDKIAARWVTHYANIVAAKG